MGQDAVPSLGVISANHTNNVDCCTKMFTEWRQRTSKLSWKQLIEALKEVELTQLASELEELLIPSHVEKCAVKKSEVSLNNQQGSAGICSYS